MSKVVKVYNSDYKISVQDGGTITLDTGPEIGTTVITGDLEVLGTTTTVESTVVTINDNIIVLSDGTAGAGLPSSLGYKSGIEIDRGSLSNAQWLFYEQISWTLGGDSGQGTFYATRTDGQTLPIATSGIVLNGASNLYITTGNGVISVTNTNNYEEKVFNYAAGVIVPDGTGKIIVDDDHIPNAKSIVDFFEYSFNNIVYDNISEGDTKVETIDEYHTINAIVSVGATTVIQTVGQHGFTTSDTVEIAGISAGGDAIENLNGTGITITEIVSPTVFRVLVDTTGGTPGLYVGNGIVSKTGYIEARVKIDVSNINTANFYNNRFELYDVKIQDSEISTIASNQDLILSAPGTGSVKIKDIIEIPTIPYEDDLTIIPTAPLDGIRLYASAQGTGKVGLYYVNSNSVNDELISKNRALLFSMLF